jgi:hypothetical protein
MNSISKCLSIYARRIVNSFADKLYNESKDESRSSISMLKSCETCLRSMLSITLEKTSLKSEYCEEICIWFLANRSQLDSWLTKDFEVYVCIAYVCELFLLQNLWNTAALTQTIAEQFECSETEEISSFTKSFSNSVSSTASLLVAHCALRFCQLRVFQSITEFTSRS